jgi:hypothetical protein
VASYPRQIPAGGEGTIRIKVDTSGFGGRRLRKMIDVFTNDPAQVRVTLTITGKVLNFARMEPAFARLVGPAGTDIKKTIVITPEKAYPFKIIGATARHGNDIALDIKAFSQADGDGYLLTIENKKTAAGRYADTVILTTDSRIKPTITVPVYGQIIAATPPSAPIPPEERSNDG